MANGFGDLKPQQGAAPTSQPGLDELLQQARVRQAQKFAQGPSEGEKLMDIGEQMAAGYRGGRDFSQVRQLQSQRQAQETEQLGTFLAREDEKSLQLAAQSFEQQKAAGDEFATEIETMFPDEYQRANAVRQYMLWAMDRVAKDPSITDDDQIPIQEKRNVMRSIAAISSPAAAAPEGQSIVVGGNDPLNAQLGLNIPSGTNARVEIQRDKDGNIISGTVKAGFVGTPASTSFYGDQETEFRKKSAGAQSERINIAINAGQKAHRDKFEIERMKTAIVSGRFTTGSFSDARVVLGRLAEYFVGPALTEDTQWLKWVGDAATADTLDAASKRLAADAAKELGRITNMSLGFIRDSLPALSRSPTGNLILLEVMDRIADRDMAVSQIAQNYDELGTVYPEDEPSYFKAVRDYDKDNPVITDNIRKKIKEGIKASHRNWQEVFDANLPEGVPKGSVQIGVTDPGGHPVYKLPDGSQKVYK